jgi:hypothetical protein
MLFSKKKIDLEAVIRKAMENNTFRTNLLQNPKQALQREFGVELPDDVRVEVLEDNEKVLRLYLPPLPPPPPSVEPSTSFSSGYSDDYDDNRDSSSEERDTGSAPGRYYC